MEQIEIGVVLDITANRTICRLDLPMLVQQREQASTRLEAVTSVGGYIKIRVGGHWLLGVITEVRVDRADPKGIVGEIDLIGEGKRESDGGLSGFQRGMTFYPLPGDRAYIAVQADLDQVFSSDERQHIEIGTVHPTSDVRAALLFDKMLSRHFAILGATGTGKSTLTALILHRILAAAPEGHIVMLDPHGEYGAAFSAAGRVYSVENLQIPYWAMNLEEHCQAFINSAGDSRAIDVDIMAKCLLAARTANKNDGDTGAITADSPIPYAVHELIEALNIEMSRLEKQADAHRYINIKLNIEQYFLDNRYNFIFDPNYRNLSITKLIGDLVRIPVEGKPISIVDLSGVPSDIADVIVSILARLIFDYTIWTPREDRLPILLVCEEAQRYLPALRPDTDMAAERQLERIAREGRKYGISLGVIAQRPSELSEAALSQCGTIISMRLNNLRDQAQVRNTLPEGARSFVDLLPALQNRECIICGQAVHVPARVRIDELEQELKPASEDPIFSKVWNEYHEGNGQVVETVRRWREGN